MYYVYETSSGKAVFGHAPRAGAKTDIEALHPGKRVIAPVTPEANKYLVSADFDAGTVTWGDVPANHITLNRQRFEYFLRKTRLDEIFAAMDWEIKHADRELFAKMNMKLHGSVFYLDETMRLVSKLSNIIAQVGRTDDLSQATLTNAWMAARDVDVHWPPDSDAVTLVTGTDTTGTDTAGGTST